MFEDWNEWHTIDWVVLVVFILFVLAAFSWAYRVPTWFWDPKPQTPYGTEAGSRRMPPGYHDIEDAYDDGPMVVPEPSETYTWFVNSNPLCVSEDFDTEDGFWSFYNGDDLVLIYAPKPGDTLHAEEGGDI